jgi:hypothetical protein
MDERGETPAALYVSDRASEAIDLFKRLPDFARRFTPKSDYLHKAVQPELEDLLFLGREYERHFDRFEILYALCHADLREHTGQPLWGPPGRFGWKSRRGLVRGPFDSFVEEAMAAGDSWSATKAGLFSGSIIRFKQIADGYRAGILNHLPWF